MALAPLPPIPNTRLVDDPTRDAIWRRYLEQLFNRVNPLTDVHNDLTGLQGGTTAQYYHLTQAQHSTVTSFGSFPNNRVIFTGPTSSITTASTFTFTSSGTFSVTGTVNPVAFFTRSTNFTNAAAGSFKLKHLTSGDMVDGFGSAQDFFIQDNAGVENQIASFIARRSGADNSGTMSIRVFNAGSAVDVSFFTNLGYFLMPGSSKFGATTAPAATLDVAGSALISGGIGLSTRDVVSSYAVATGDFNILANASGVAFTVTLPHASSAPTKIYVVKKTDSSGNAVTVSSVSNIDGATTTSLAAQFNKIMIQSNAVQWWEI